MTRRRSGGTAESLTVDEGGVAGTGQSGKEWANVSDSRVSRHRWLHKNYGELGLQNMG
jgi:hypothetical protein